jgi:hypothetical protein
VKKLFVTISIDEFRISKLENKKKVILSDKCCIKVYNKNAMIKDKTQNKLKYHKKYLNI